MPVRTVSMVCGYVCVCVGPAAFCLGCRHVGRSHVVWQLRQRPDKDPNSDRYHKVRAAAGRGSLMQGSEDCVW